MKKTVISTLVFVVGLAIGYIAYNDYRKNKIYIETRHKSWCDDTRNCPRCPYYKECYSIVEE